VSNILLCAENIDRGKRVDIFLAENIENLTRSAAANIVAQGGARREDKVLKKSDKVDCGDVISVDIPEPEECDAKPQNIPLDIVYEDKHLLVVNKAQGMVVHPAPGNPDGTLVNALLYHCEGSLSGINGVLRPGIVHRIDKDTSGLLIVAKNDEAHISLSKQISEHSFVRRYKTVIRGRMKDMQGSFALPIGRNPKDRKKMAITADGRMAVTHYKTNAVYTRSNEAYSYLDVTLETGRTHQIRVHFSSCGHPVAGDPLYGLAERDRRFFPHLFGQCLHAGYIEFTHPISGERMKFESELPEYFAKTLEILEGWN